MMRDHALRYAADGWPVFPCRPRDKRPEIENGFLSATADPEQLRAWWRQAPRANIGFVPGRAGMVVVDIDGPESEAAARRFGLLSEPTLTAITARGCHLYYAHPGGKIGNRKLAGVLDVRADRGYVLLPPSVHPTGHVYHWHDPAAPVLTLPPVVIGGLDVYNRRQVANDPRNAPVPPIDAGTPRRRAYVIAAIEREATELASTPPGGRNNRLNEAAYALARFVATGEARADKLADLLADAARTAGLDDFEIDRTIKSAFEARGVTA